MSVSCRVGVGSFMVISSLTAIAASLGHKEWVSMLKSDCSNQFPNGFTPENIQEMDALNQAIIHSQEAGAPSPSLSSREIVLIRCGSTLKYWEQSWAVPLTIAASITTILISVDYIIGAFLNNKITTAK